jgi:hypothetical protein
VAAVAEEAAGVVVPEVVEAEAAEAEEVEVVVVAGRPSRR